MTASKAFPKIEGITVDLEAISGIEHLCNPDECLKCNCCYNCEVVINDRELDAIISCLPSVSKYIRGIKSDDSYLNIFDELAPNQYSIDLNEKNYCMLSYSKKSKNRLCSLHTTAIANNWDPAIIKPQVCILWPLVYIERPKTLLSVVDDALSFPCNNRRDANTAGIDQSIADTIKSIFGSKFLDNIQKEKHLENRGHFDFYNESQK